MKILLTGASSFTGYWFAETLAAAGHHVVAPLRGALDTAADKERSERLRRLADKVELIPECPFGAPDFLDIASSRNFDLLCHHAAEVGDYRNPDFDIAAAVAKNTLNLGAVIKTMSERGVTGLALTGSYFEYDEGAGSQPLLAFSPYGVSKGLTAQIVRHRCHEFGIPYGKFVIPHPFGPLEQPRLGTYLAKTWMSGAVAQIKTPTYLRDNIHVDLLAAAYRRFVEQPRGSANERKLSPSGYVESQGAFVERIAREISSRLKRELRGELLHQTEFLEPVMRVNTDSAVRYVSHWDESGISTQEYLKAHRHRISLTGWPVTSWTVCAGQRPSIILYLRHRAEFKGFRSIPYDRVIWMAVPHPLPLARMSTITYPVLLAISG